MENNIKGTYTATHRGLHWSMALLMFVLFITGFLRINWMGKRTIITAVEQNTQGINLSKEQMQAIAKSIISPMWQWHEYAAYIISFLFLARIVYMLIRGIAFPNPFAKLATSKERLQGFAYLLFYLFTATSVITGFYIKWGSGSLKGPMESVHKWAVYWFPIFILVHFCGIVIGEFTNQKGIISKMIRGND